MKISKFFAVLFGLAALAAAAATLWVCRYAMNAPTVLLAQPAAAVYRVDGMMHAVCAGDYDGAGKYMYGTPSLGAPITEDDGVTRLLWDAFADSISYEKRSELYATNSGVAMDLRISFMDVSVVTDALKDEAKTLLEARAEAVEDLSEIYDENNEYRADFVQQIILDAAKISLEAEPRMQSRDVTVYLVYDNSQWWIVPDAALVGALSGGLNG